MRIKRVHGTDMRSALERVREELGPDAVIISTRTLGTTQEERRGGLTGVEVVAGVDDQPERSAVAQARVVAQNVQGTVAGREPSPVAPAAARAAYALARTAGGEVPATRGAGLPLSAVQTPEPTITRPSFPRVDRNGEDVADIESLTPALEALAARRNQGLRTVTSDETAAAMTSGTVTPIRLQKTPVVADAPRKAARAEDFFQVLRSAVRSVPVFTQPHGETRPPSSGNGAASADESPFARISRSRAPLPARIEEAEGDEEAGPASMRQHEVSFAAARPTRPSPRYVDDEDGMPALAPGLRSHEDGAGRVAAMSRRVSLSAGELDAGVGDAEGFFDAPPDRGAPRPAGTGDDIEAWLHAAVSGNPALRPGTNTEPAVTPDRSNPEAGRDKHTVSAALQTPVPTRNAPAPQEPLSVAPPPMRSSAAVPSKHGELPSRPTVGASRTGNETEGERRGERQALLDAAETAFELLCRAGLSEPVAESALEAAIAIVPAAALTRATVLAEAALSRVIAGLPDIPALSAAALRDRAVFFVGPAGSGKTSALLKAAVLLRRAGADVGIACADMLRIGTSEQMQRYGDLLRMPVALIHSADDLAATLTEAPPGRITLVDTPASGLARSVEGDDLAALIAAAPLPLVVMTVGAGTSDADLRRLAAHARALDAAAVAITKLDEAEAAGAALNVLAGLRLPPLLCSDGRDLLGDVSTPAPAELAAAALDAALPQPAAAPGPDGWVYQGKRVSEFDE